MASDVFSRHGFSRWRALRRMERAGKPSNSASSRSVAAVVVYLKGAFPVGHFSSPALPAAPVCRHCQGSHCVRERPNGSGLVRTQIWNMSAPSTTWLRGG